MAINNLFYGGIVFFILFIILMTWWITTYEENEIKLASDWALPSGAIIFLIFSIVFFIGGYENTGTIPSNASNIVQYKDLPRKPFPEWVKQSTMQNQDGKCNMCGIPLNNYIAQYDHEDNDKTNNQPSNCQALCANCHSEKTKTNR